MRHTVSIVMLMLPSLGLASGLSTDISMSPVAASAASVGPVQLSSVATAGTYRVGWAMDYTHRPMDQYHCSSQDPADCSEVVGTVIGDRVVGVASLAVAVSRKTWIEATIPAVAQWGGTVSPLSPDGVAFGDPRLGVRSRIISGAQTLGLYAEGSLPMGKRGVWFSDTSPTGHAGVVGTSNWGKVTAVADVAAWVRTSPDTNPWDFRLGSALLADAGVHVAINYKTSVWTVAQGRFTSDSPAIVGWAGVAVNVSPALRIDAGVGRALVTAPGAGPLHGRLTVTYSRDRQPKRVERDSQSQPVDPPAVPAPVSWEDGETCRVIDDVVELRDDIAFVASGTQVSLGSYPNLLALAEWLMSNDAADHLLIAAYASSEGSSAANYTLSLGRAQAIADALVTAGVPRSSLSYKGMGMLAPDADSGEHQVTVDGEAVSFMTLTIPDSTVPDEPNSPSFDEWIASEGSP